MDDDKAMLEFLLRHFQISSLHMNGQHSYRFRSTFWPLNHMRGPTVRDAIRTAMEVESKELAKAKIKETNE